MNYLIFIVVAILCFGFGYVCGREDHKENRLTKPYDDIEIIDLDKEDISEN